MSENVCQHFREYYKEFGLKTFELVHAFFSVSTTTDARRRKVKKLIKENYRPIGFHFKSTITFRWWAFYFKKNLLFNCRLYHACVTHVEEVVRNCFPAFIASTLDAKDRIYLTIWKWTSTTLHWNCLMEWFIAMRVKITCTIPNAKPLQKCT